MVHFAKQCIFIMNRSINELFRISLFVLIISQGTSCLDEEVDNCELSVTFEYSYNIFSTNVLSDQADIVTLCVFDERGILMAMQSSERMTLTNDFHMSLKSLAAGSYSFVAWARSMRSNAKDGGFDIPEPIIGSSSLSQMNYYMKRSGGIQQEELDNLLVGVTEVKINGNKELRNITINLKKVNKKFRIMLLPYADETELDINDYAISITDKIGNGHILYDYSLLPDESITYRPYYEANIRHDPPIISGKVEISRACVAEINTFRLMESNSLRLHISTKDNNQEVLDLDLIQFLSLTEMESHKNWNLQEYLDRQDEYVIGLFIHHNTWIKSTVIINGWEINNLNLNI